MLRHLTIVLISTLALACAEPSAPTPNPEKADGAAACESDESILSCLTEQCPDLTGDAFDACFTDNCEEGHDDTPLDCGLCIVNGFEAGEDAAAIAATCTGSSEPATLTSVACASDDLALFACLDNNCPDADSSDDLGECIADFCTTEVEQTAITCLMCVDAEAGQDTDPDATLQTLCTAADSAPCDVDRAATMQACAEDLCTGLQGDPLDECMGQECPDVFDDVTEQCGGCIIALNQNGVPFGDAAANCAGH